LALEIKEIKRPKLLIVEGRDDELFFSAFCHHLGLNDIQVLHIGGKTKLPSHLKALKKATDFSRVTALGIIRDADEDANAAFQSVCSALQHAGLPIPPKPMTPSSGRPRVSVMILPDNQSPGALEDVCLKALVGTPAMLCVGEFFCCLRRYNLPPPRNLSKAKVLAYLTSMPEPDKRLGESAQAGYWDQHWNHSVFDALRNFLRSL
jgi:hypothetical protein